MLGEKLSLCASARLYVYNTQGRCTVNPNISDVIRDCYDDNEANHPMVVNFPDGIIPDGTVCLARCGPETFIMAKV